MYNLKQADPTILVSVTDLEDYETRGRICFESRGRICFESRGPISLRAEGRRVSFERGRTYVESEEGFAEEK